MNNKIYDDKKQIWNDDCIDVMNNIQEKSIDLILTDPPYLQNYKTNYRKDDSHEFTEEIEGSDDEGLIVNFIKQSYRVLKEDKAFYCFCNTNKIGFFKNLIDDVGFNVKNVIVWKKNNWTAGDLEASFGHQYEFLILANKGRKKFHGKRLTDVWEFDRVAGNGQLHQNQKPIDLIKRCIKWHSQESEIVFDPFCGSGTTLIGAEELNRNWIGCEVDENEYEKAVNRLDKVID